LITDYKFDPKKCGQRLKKSREAKNLTQEEVRKHLQYTSRGTISSHESGERMPRPDEMLKMSQLYDVSIDWLIMGEAAQETAGKQDKAVLLFQNPTSAKAIALYDKMLKAGFNEKEIENFIDAAIALTRKSPPK